MFFCRCPTLPFPSVDDRKLAKFIGSSFYYLRGLHTSFYPDWSLELAWAPLLMAMEIDTSVNGGVTQEDVSLDQSWVRIYKLLVFFCCWWILLIWFKIQNKGHQWLDTCYMIQIDTNYISLDTHNTLCFLSFFLNYAASADLLQLLRTWWCMARSFVQIWEASRANKNLRDVETPVKGKRSTRGNFESGMSRYEFRM